MSEQAFTYTKHRRVVVTGVGPITSVGIGKDAFWSSITAGRSGSIANEQFDCSEIASKVIAPVRDFEAADYMPPKSVKRTDRYTHFSMAATQLAMTDAGVALDERSPRRGVYIGTAFGGAGTMVDGCRTLYDQGLGRLSAFTVQMMLPNIAVGHVARMIGAQGFNEACHTACASGANSIGEAFLNVRRGLLDVAVAGGSEAAIVQLFVAGFSKMAVLSTRQCEPAAASRPFDEMRDGFVLAEGAGVLVLEELEHALARSARIYAELKGYGNCNEAFDPLEPDETGRGQYDAMQRAVDDGAALASDVDAVFSGASGSVSWDRAESLAIAAFLGERRSEVPVTALKSMTGQALGAGGAIDAVGAVLALATGTVPPTINLDDASSVANLRYAPKTATASPIRSAICNSFAFGGQNVSLYFTTYSP